MVKLIKRKIFMHGKLRVFLNIELRFKFEMRIWMEFPHGLNHI